MAARTPRLLPVEPPEPQEPPNSVLLATGAPAALIASGGSFAGSSGAVGQGTQPWQEMAWSYFRSQGQLNQGYTWYAKTMARVRLVAAEEQPGGAVPIILESGPAVDIVNELSWNSPTIMYDLTLYKLIPGRGYLVGRTIGTSDERDWCAYSPDQVRLNAESERARKNPYNNGANLVPVYDLQEDNKNWARLDDALVVPVRTPDPQYKWMDTSPTQALLSKLREIDLYDREIVSSLVSRLANNGLLILPEEMTYASRTGQNDGRDPFVLDIIETAKQAIADPGSASAAIPFIIKVPAKFIDSIKHILIAAGVDEKVLNARELAYDNLADAMPMPRENVVGGMSNVNHWSGALITKEAIKTYFAPSAADICQDLTRNFLWPLLLASKENIKGPNGGRLIVWYDTTKLSENPDKADRAVQAYDADVITAEVLARELGFSPEEMPDDEQLLRQLLIKMISQPANARAALLALTGSDLGISAGGAGSDTGGSETPSTSADAQNDTSAVVQDDTQPPVPDAPAEV